MPNFAFSLSVEMPFLYFLVITRCYFGIFGFWIVLAGPVTEPLLASSFELEETLPRKRCCTSKAAWKRVVVSLKAVDWGDLETSMKIKDYWIIMDTT